jgi:hypothetical protein
MEPGRLRCQAVALIAAYAMALQILLSAFLPATPVALAAPLTVLCTYDSGGNSGHPVQHDLPCAALCAALAHGIAGPLPPDPVVAVATPTIVTAAAPINDWVPPNIDIKGPWAPRGPPLA